MKTYFFIALTLSASLSAVTDLGQSLAAGTPGEKQRLLEQPRNPHNFMGSVAGGSEDGRKEHTTVTLGNTVDYREDSCCVVFCSQCAPVLSCGDLCCDCSDMCNKDSVCVEACCSPLAPVLSCGNLCPESRLLQAVAWSTGTLGGGAFALWALGII